MSVLVFAVWYLKVLNLKNYFFSTVKLHFRIHLSMTTFQFVDLVQQYPMMITLMTVCTIPFQKERALTAARFFSMAHPKSRIPHNIM